MVSTPNSFDDIRPFETPEEVEGGLEILVEAIRTAKIPLANGIAAIAKRYLRNVKTTLDFQKKAIVNPMKLILKKTTSGVEYNWNPNLETGHGYLFVSNHRDIMLDSILANIEVFKHWGRIPYIAAGSNLYGVPEMEAFLKLNNSIKVTRTGNIRHDVRKLREFYSYVNYLLAQGKDVWIAQGPGRSKDGNDITSEALIKLAQKYGIQPSSIVPISVSYEYEPCDVMLAAVAECNSRQVPYEKTPGEDTKHLTAGLFGKKGGVSIVFGEPLKCEPNQTVSELNRQIIENYHIWDTNKAAFASWFEQTNNNQYSQRNSPDFEILKQHLVFYDRIMSYPDALRSFVLMRYANPLKNLFVQQGAVIKQNS